MTAYWALFCLPLLWGLMPRAAPIAGRIGIGFLTLVYIIAIGLRYKIGCDWHAYVLMYQVVERLPFEKALFYTEPGYQALNILSYWLGFGYVGVNIASASIFMGGLLALVRRQPLPWLTFTCAVPYLIDAVAMGYQRQSLAIGMIMLAINAFADRKVGQFIVFVLIGALFHKTAIIILPLAILVNGFRLNAFSVLFLLGTVAIGSRAILVQSQAYYTNYVTANMHSGGALVRILMTGLAGALFILYRSRFRKLFSDSDIMTYFAIASISVVPLLAVASTATDRIALYLIPFQIVTFGRFPIIFKNTPFYFPAIFGIVISYSAVLFVWLNYSPEIAYCWLPYGNFIF